jgi:mono/diheme cytochrome c family protein
VRRPIATLALLLPLAAVAAGCGSSTPKGLSGAKVVLPLPTKVVGTLPKVAKQTLPPAYAHGDATAGKQVFLTAGCKGCHTLKDAGATGTVGPNLDQAKPPASLVFLRVTQGAGAMPSFKGQLSQKQIADVIAYVTKATGGNANG